MMEKRVYTQHDRNQLMMALLDITIGQLRERMPQLRDDEVPEEVNNLFGLYCEQLFADEVDGQLMFQALAQMSDATMHKTVQLFGTDPLA